MFSSLMLPVSAHITSHVKSINPWQPPENFVDPVTLKIQEFRAEGLSDDEISELTVRLFE
jgi:hypothetical protein